MMRDIPAALRPMPASAPQRPLASRRRSASQSLRSAGLRSASAATADHDCTSRSSITGVRQRLILRGEIDESEAPREAGIASVNTARRTRRQWTRRVDNRSANGLRPRRIAARVAYPVAQWIGRCLHAMLCGMSSHPSPGSGAVAQLRSRTALTHAALDRRLELAGAHASAQGYVSYLRFVRDYMISQSWLWQGRSETLAPFLADGWQPLRDLEYDLAAIEHELGCTGSFATGESLQIAGCLASVPADATLWGAAYVVLGSRLGSKAILARLGPQRGSLSTRFLMGCREYGLEWRIFIDTLDAVVVGDEAIAACLQGAESAFSDAHRIADWHFGGHDARRDIC